MAMTTSLKEMSLGESTYLLHHVFLPPKLPQSEDYNPEYEQLLLESVIRTLQKFSSLVPDEDSDILVSTANAISCLRDICEHDGSIDQAKLKKSLGSLNDQDGLLPIYVREQNAGIIMSSNEDTIQFESFELSPRNEDVMSTSGRLQRVFPGPGLALDRATFNERGFQSAIAQPIALMSHQSVAGTKEKIAKAHQEHDEDRDTTNPKMVTSFIMTILRPRSTDSEWLQIHKNTREEVLWRDCRMPWRRSAFWLFIRVVVQIVIRRRSRGERENDLFKEFMIYFMSQVVSKCDEKMPRESVYLMCAKIGRRMRKLNLTTEPAWFDSVQLILRQASSTVEAKWREIRAQNERKLRVSSLGRLEFLQDTHFRLPILDQYLHEIDPRNRESPEDSAEYQPVSNLLIYPPSELPQILITNHPEDTPYNLHGFENWVAFNLDEWLRCHKADEDTCGLLDDLMTRYHTAAFACHSQNPEAVSVMLLTLLELWIACDKSALHIYPILSDYDPFIPVNILESLVLPLRSQMTRLARAEKYLRDRSSNQKHHGPGVFTDFGTESSFSVRYFDQSEDLQLLLDKIRSHAVQERRNKVSELRKKQKMYQNLQSLAGQERCEYDDVQVTTGRRKAAVWQTRHRLPCSRCSHLSTARSLEIEVHEWPLPSDKLEAKSTVFELRVPRAFSHWRDATMFFLLDVLRMDYRSGRRPVSKNTLRTYSGLSNFFQTSREGNPRIFLLSEVKPHERTHRKKKPIINVTENDILLKNGLRLQYFDGQVQNFVGDIQSTVDVPKICNYRLPEQSSCLQQFLFRPPRNSDGLSPNTVISSQNSAPADMRLEEYRALAAMPLGVQIQWQNILLQLASSAVNFRKVETSVFFLQIMNQAGPPTNSELRQGHKILEDERFLMAMLDRIDEVLQRIKENWELVQGLCGLIFLVEKILSFSSSRNIQEYCMLELSQFRETAFRWITLIRMMVGQAADEAQKVSLIGRVVHLAFVCAETFNVEEVTGIIADPSNLSVLLQCCILIHDWKLSLPMDSDPLLPILHHRWEVSMYRYHPIVANSIIQQQNAGLDMALNSAWPAFKQQSGWSRALNGVDSWMVTRASPLSSNCKDMIVHFNLLTGQLLVNGLPMARLSPDYESHRAYKCLFGKCQLDVMPSDLQGMKFSARKRHMDHVIHLGEKAIPDSEEWDLLVEANKGNETWRFVSSRIFASAFPDAFSEGYAHWYNSNKGYVEFRPIQNPWESSISNWILRKDESNDTWCLEKDEICLINPSSSTAKLISQTFAPVEMQRKLHCFMKRASSALEIDLPRLRLKFALSPGSSVIRSCQYPGMSVDANQSLGSLIGLQDKLVLVHTKSGHRIILVPEGKVTRDRKHQHVEIKVGWQSRTNVHSYSVDEELGRITDNGSIQSKLLLAYLHALTSFCLPDPLTKFTGTEQALSILRSASLRSFDKLRPENKELLTLIAKLSPRRSYYPQDKEVMQSVKWDFALDSLSQHSGFYEEAMAIFRQHNEMEVFYPELELQDAPPLPNNTKLLNRDLMRSASFRISGFGAEDHPRLTCFDKEYTGRSSTSQFEYERSRVYSLCKMLYDDIPRIRHIEPPEMVLRIWGFLSKAERIHGPAVHIDPARLKYDAELALTPKEFLASHWCSIHRLIFSSSRPSKFQFMIWLSTIALSEQADMITLELIASLYTVPELGSPPLPHRMSFSTGRGYQVDRNSLRDNLYLLPISDTPEGSLTRNLAESDRAYYERKHLLFEARRSTVSEILVTELEGQWPIRSPREPSCEMNPKFSDYMDMKATMNNMEKQFAVWYDNKELRQHHFEIATLLTEHEIHHVRFPPYCPLPQAVFPLRKSGFVSFHDLLKTPPAAEKLERPHIQRILRAHPTTGTSISQLVELTDWLRGQAKTKYETWYSEQLRGSIKSLQEVKAGASLDLNATELKQTIGNYLARCEEYTRAIENIITSNLKKDRGETGMADSKEAIEARVLAVLFDINQCPRISTSLILEQLMRHRWSKLTKPWKDAFIVFGEAITVLQRAKRLMAAVENVDDFLREFQNPGHVNWDPSEFPESLLLEIESGILIREVQERIARQMRGSYPDMNVVMQLNMGEGKSSVIVPMVVPPLATGSCLIRVIVAKPQSRQMFQMLVSKLGGLLNRWVYHMPISRSLKLSVGDVKIIERMCLECMENGGVLLVQPENILSLKLMCLERYVEGDSQTGIAILQILHLFENSSRDIVDESDENFNVKFELIYTMGAQCPVELSPQRWILIQQLLGIVSKCAPMVKAELPDSIEITEQVPGRFSRIRILDSKAEEMLLELIATYVCEVGMDSLPISRQPKSIREAVKSYITKKQLTTDQIATVEHQGPQGFWTEATKSPLLLLRGLVAGGVLGFCFRQKRWRVNYGPHSNRIPPTKLCVPYRAKDSPSLRSEFSHPDVVIVLTSLHYYYAGLDNEELSTAFLHLLKSDQADIEYQTWIKDAPDLPHAFRQLVGVNLDDQFHCIHQIFPALRFSKATIDYFLAHIVFSKEMKAFPKKLSASVWDIGEIKTHSTTGFSGTNDSQRSLPLSVCQLDLPEQNHTNAQVLRYMLQSENLVTSIPERLKAVSDAELLLNTVMTLDTPVQVILDVGAQVLELSNLEVAKCWLKIVPAERLIQAIIFIDDNDDICVVDRQGRVESLQVSPFSRQMEACYVFLDEAHTRGIDLKLPAGYRAAVTLGAGITKDKLVQACMRMRKLGHGQSVIFCIPKEIESKILTLTGKTERSSMEVRDVLCWAISETWDDNRRMAPLWAVQGRRFERHCKIWEDVRKSNYGTMTLDQAERFLEPELETLEDRYRPGHKKSMSSLILTSHFDSQSKSDLIANRCREFGDLDFGSSMLHEEQERELAPEVERERQVEGPPSAKPEDHCIHPDLRSFVETGKLTLPSGAYLPAFQALVNTSAASFLDVSEFPSDLLVTRDFATTVQKPSGSQLIADSFQRPVQWILTSCHHRLSRIPAMEHMIVISPYEANHLISVIRASQHVSLRIYAPRQNEGFSPLDRLGLFTISGNSISIQVPDNLRIQLNLFSGQLYLESYLDYQMLCKLLGVAFEKTPDGLTVAADGFITSNSHGLKPTFSQSPLKFLQVLMSQIRKDCQDVSKTHLGQILNGQLLCPSDFEEPESMDTTLDS